MSRSTFLGGGAVAEAVMAAAAAVAAASWVAVVGRLFRTVQGYFWRAFQRSDAIRAIRPDR
jgi:hypothetical protein